MGVFTSRIQIHSATNSCCKEPLQKKSPRFRGLSNSTGAAYRIRTCDVLIRSQTLYPAEVTPQRVVYIAIASQWRQPTISNFFLAGDQSQKPMARQKKSPRFRGLSNSTGAAYRIRTCDVLIRSQTLYPAEVTPQRVVYIAISDASRQGKISIFSNYCNLASRLTTISRSQPP